MSHGPGRRDILYAESECNGSKSSNHDVLKSTARLLETKGFKVKVKHLNNTHSPWENVKAVFLGEESRKMGWREFLLGPD